MPPRPALPAAPGMGPGPTLLQVQCGTCGRLINVHALHLETLMQLKFYTCPNCKSKQTIDVDAGQEQLLLAQARQYKATAIAQQQQQQQQTPLQMNSQIAALLQRAQAAAAGRAGPGRPPLPYSSLHGAMAPPRPPLPGLQTSMDNFLPGAIDLMMEDEEDVEEGEVRDTFQAYRPSKLPYGQAHPDDVVETSSLAAVEPPDITYELAAKEKLVDEKRLSALQLEAIVYACQRHEQRLPSGARGGFFIGDGAGVGKGRTIAGLIVENWAQGRRKHIWVSIGADLKFDARRDLDDAGAPEIDVHALNKLPYGKLAGHKIGVKEGVIFLTYSSLVSSSDRGLSRFKQLVEWCGPDFDGLIVFDESHKAKNLVPEAGGRSTQVGMKVQEIQSALPGARIVYCSATGASEPRNMGYMVRLGLWGEGHQGFKDFSRFLEAVQTKGSGNMAALELVAMDMKAQGMYVCRTLSFHGAEFETVNAPLEEPVASQYAAATAAWNLLYREFLAGEESAAQAADALQDGRKPTDSGAVSGTTSGRSSRGGFGSSSSMMWRSFWAAHQRFFRHMCMAAKVPAAVRMAQNALASGKCVVIGLQSTGEARTADVVAEKGEELDDFVSGPKELLLRLVDSCYPLPPNPLEEIDVDESDSDEEFENDRVIEAAAKGHLESRMRTSRQSKVAVRYKEFDSDEEIGDSSSDEEENSDEEDSSDDEESSASEDGSAEGAKSKSASAGGPSASHQDGSGASDGDSQGSGAESDPEFDPVAAAAEARRRKEDKEESLDTAQRAEKEASEELRRLRREHAVAAYTAALENRDKVRAVVEKLELPPNPLDDLIDRLGGPPEVAEMTGRKGRLVRDLKNGMVKYEPRNASGVGASATLEMINVHERGLFSDGTKLIAIISEAASAGISLHADLRVKNQRRRVHLTLELPWSADKAIQQFGRSHRANQASGPQYRLIFTPLGGERRFAAAVARRLESLGALTQGDRRAGPSLAEFNYESTWGQRALRETYGAILEENVPPAVIPLPCRPGPGGEPPLEPLHRFLGRARAQLLNCGILRPQKQVITPLHMDQFLTMPEGAPKGVASLEERDRGDVPRFLNRLLGLDPHSQADIFDFYQATLDDLTERARREGTLDEGIVDLKAQSISLDGPPQVLHKDPVTGAPTLLQAIKLDRGLPWDRAVEMLKAHLAEAEVLSAVDAVLSPKLAAVEQAQQEPAQKEDTAPVTEVKTEEKETALPMDDTPVPAPVEKEVAAGGKEEDAGPAAAAAAVEEIERTGTDGEMKLCNNDGGLGKRPREIAQETDLAAPKELKEEKGDKEDSVAAKKAKLEQPAAPETATAGADELTDTAIPDVATNGVETINKQETTTAADAIAPSAVPMKAEEEGPQEEKEEHGGKKSVAGATDGASGSIVDLTNDSDEEKGDDDGANKTTPAKRRGPLLWDSGFYRGRQEIGGKTHVLLALKVAGSQPPHFAIIRPTTGRARKPFTLRELKDKYLPIEEEACKPQWEAAHKDAGEPNKDGKPALRHRTVHILCGAVMRSWAAVQRAMVRYVKKNERRMRVLRIATTGEESLRLVGMFIPEAAVDSVVEELTGGKKKDETSTEGEKVNGGTS